MLKGQLSEALSDEDLMLRYLSGDDKAFETVYTRRRAGLRRFFERQCGSAAVGQELAQEVWFKLIRACEQGKYTAEAKFTTYLYRVARNTLIDWYRKHGNFKTVELHTAGNDDDEGGFELEDETVQNPEELYGEQQRVEMLLSAVDELSSVQKATLLMHLEGDMTYEEIAVAMDTNRETVKTRLRYARQALKKRLGHAD